MLPAPFAQGQTATVHAWHGGTVLKLFRPGVPRADIEAEARSARIAHTLDVGAPRVGDLVETEDGLGLVYERVPGRSMLERLIADPADAPHLALRIADLHARVHSRPAPATLPAQARLLGVKIDRAGLPAALHDRVTHALARVPTGDRLCHGDFHPANVMLDGDCHAVIDWNDAARGSPALDVARTTVVLRGATFGEPLLIVDQARVIEDFHTAYLDRYFGLCPDRREAYLQCLPLAAAGRISECGAAAKPWLLELVGRCG